MNNASTVFGGFGFNFIRFLPSRTGYRVVQAPGPPEGGLRISHAELSLFGLFCQIKSRILVRGRGGDISDRGRLWHRPPGRGQGTYSEVPLLLFFPLFFPTWMMLTRAETPLRGPKPADPAQPHHSTAQPHHSTGQHPP